MQEATDLTAALAAMRVVVSRAHTASDDELLADLDLVEQLGRIVDGQRIRLAAEVEARSRKLLGQGSLAFREGARDATELVRSVARIDHRTAKARIGLGTALAPEAALDGSLLPGALPSIREAVESGEVGVESARLIVNTVKDIRRRVDPAHVDELVGQLVETARHVDTEQLLEAVVEALAFLDPDGAEPRARVQHLKRAARIMRTLSDGTTRMSVILQPEDLARVKELFASRRHGRSMVHIEAGTDATDETLGPEWRPEDVDDRTNAQQDYDTVMETLAAGIAAEHVSGAVTHEVVVTITADELEARRGQGWTSGVLAGLSIPVVETIACSGGTRLLVTDKTGEPLHLSRRQRVFTAGQKKSLIARAGGRCEFPGCRVPAPYLEADHVSWWHHDRGRTDVGNGVMLCSFHHLIHARHARVEIRKHAGQHWFVPVGHRGTPRPEHQARSGPPGTPPPDIWRR